MKTRRPRSNMGTVRPGRRLAIRIFLRNLAGWQPGEFEPDSVHAQRREAANTVLRLIGEEPDDLEMVALESLAHATLALCDDPLDPGVIAAVEGAGRWLLEISPIVP